MTDLPERAGHRQLRVSDADREQVAEMLREATGQGRITFDELEERLTRTYAARTYADLEEVTQDLPGPGVRAPVAARGGAFPAERIGGTPGTALAVAVMSGAERTGQWVVPPAFTAVAFMGGVELDLRQARFSQREVTIHAYAFMGGISIIAGDDIELDVSGIGFMGGFDHRGSGPGVPGAPRVRVTGLAVMGGVEVRRRPLPGARRTLGGGGPPQIGA